jgi:hypothetical protein
MVRCERLASGDVKRIAVANFKARIVRDLILDDDAEQRRELGLEAELGGKGWPSWCQRRSLAAWAGYCGNWVQRRSFIPDSNSMRVPPFSGCRAGFRKNAFSFTSAGESMARIGSTSTQGMP